MVILSSGYAPDHEPMRTIRVPPVLPKRVPHNTIAGSPSQIWWALVVILSHSYAPDHGPIRAIRTSTVPSTTGSHESIGADSNMLIWTIRRTPCPAKMGASWYHHWSASWNLMSPCCQDLAGSWYAWCEHGAVDARVQCSQWLRGSEEGVVAQLDRSWEETMDCKKWTKTRLRSNYSYYRILIVEDAQPITYVCKQRWVME